MAKQSRALINKISLITSPIKNPENNYEDDQPVSEEHPAIGHVNHASWQFHLVNENSSTSSSNVNALAKYVKPCFSTKGPFSLEPKPF